MNRVRGRRRASHSRTVEKPPQLGEDFAAGTLLPVAQAADFYFGRRISLLQSMVTIFDHNSLIIELSRTVRPVQ